MHAIIARDDHPVTACCMHFTETLLGFCAQRADDRRCCQQIGLVHLLKNQGLQKKRNASDIIPCTNIFHVHGSNNRRTLTVTSPCCRRPDHVNLRHGLSHVLAQIINRFSAQTTSTWKLRVRYHQLTRRAALKQRARPKFQLPSLFMANNSCRCAEKLLDGAGKQH